MPATQLDEIVVCVPKRGRCAQPASRTCSGNPGAIFCSAYGCRGSCGPYRDAAAETHERAARGDP
jgi:hypothetical protein